MADILNDTRIANEKFPLIGPESGKDGDGPNPVPEGGMTNDTALLIRQHLVRYFADYRMEVMCPLRFLCQWKSKALLI